MLQMKKGGRFVPAGTLLLTVSGTAMELSTMLVEVRGRDATTTCHVQDSSTGGPEVEDVAVPTNS
jgi:hypothetical protein